MKKLYVVYVDSDFGYYRPVYSTTDLLKADKVARIENDASISVYVNSLYIDDYETKEEYEKEIDILNKRIKELEKTIKFKNTIEIKNHQRIKELEGKCEN